MSVLRRNPVALRCVLGAMLKSYHMPFHIPLVIMYRPIGCRFSGSAVCCGAVKHRYSSYCVARAHRSIVCGLAVGRVIDFNAIAALVFGLVEFLVGAIYQLLNGFTFANFSDTK